MSNVNWYTEGLPEGFRITLNGEPVIDCGTQQLDSHRQQVRNNPILTLAQIDNKVGIATLMYTVFTDVASLMAGFKIAHIKSGKDINWLNLKLPTIQSIDSRLDSPVKYSPGLIAVTWQIVLSGFDKGMG